MSDFDTIFQVNAEIRDDDNRPHFQRKVAVFDEISCEIALFEADNQVDEYMEQFRARFQDVSMFEALRDIYRGLFRKALRDFWDEARAKLRKQGHGEEYGYETGDDDGNV